MARVPLSLKTILITVMGIVITFLFIIIVSLFYKQNADISLKVAQEFSSVVTTNVLNELEDYFVNAEDALQTLYTIAHNDIFDVKDSDNWYDVMSSLLVADEKINALYVADFNGNFYMSKRMKDNSISKRHVARKNSKIISKWKHENRYNRFIFPEYSEMSLEEGYDPRKRSWYKNSKTTEITWTDPYVFFSDKILGITGTRRIKLKNFEGVISIDISLSYLNDFLKQLPFSNVGALLISDHKDNVIAYHDIFLDSKLQKQNLNYELSLIKTNEYVLSNEIKYMLDNYSKMKDDIPSLKRKSIIRILTDILFPSAIINSLGSININFHTSNKLFFYNNKRYIYTYSNLYSFKGVNWNLIFVIEDTTLVGDFYNTLKLGIVLLTIMFIIALILYSKLIQKISDKIGLISNLMRKIVTLKLDNAYKDTQSKLRVKEVENIGEVYNRVIKSLISFKKFVPQEVIIDSIQKNTEIVLRMENKKNISILFSDIISFTSITEKFSPLQLSDALSIYFTEMCSAITNQNGIIDKFIGDAIMALFGVFDENQNHAEQACLAALKMQVAHKIVNEKIAALSGIRFATRIGINSGQALAGVLGSTQKFNFSVLGDTVNVTSRLESLNKEYSTKILISEMTKNMLSPCFKYRALDSVQLKGKEEFTNVYQLYGYTKPQEDIQDEIKDDNNSNNNEILIEKTIDYNNDSNDSIDALLHKGDMRMINYPDDYPDDEW